LAGSHPVSWEEVVSAVYVIGDVHGQLEKLHGLLRGAELIDQTETWSGNNTLWLMGDLVDHGPDGIGAVELVMRLQRQAARAGGRLQVLLGNHDVLLLAAHRFGTRPIPGQDETFRDHWQESGGQEADLERMTPDHACWLSSLPAMALEGDHLLAHADALFYTRYGQSIPQVNQAMTGVLQSDDAASWFRLLEEFNEHQAFVDAKTGAERARAFLDCFGGRQLVHGHTPITKLTGQPPEAVREPLLYANGLCLDVDPGMYLGGPGFVCRLPSFL
jgi:calcineurin-like phosphoesterase family protein